MFFGAPKWSLQSAEENRSDMDDKLEKYYKETVPKRQRDSAGVKSLTKAEQIKFIIDLGATRGEFKKLTNEEDRVNYILNKAEDYENMDLEKLIPKYETVKEAKTEKYKELEKLSKSQQVNMLIELNITRGEMKKLKTEDDRIKFIIKKSKLKSLK